jgi:hypothetical protein
MAWNFILCGGLALSLLLPQAGVPRPPGAKTETWEAASSKTSAPYDPAGEAELLERVNQTRARQGLPPLARDEGLTRAAREHARRMASAGQLSHQFPDERELSQRVAAESKLHLDQMGENVGYAETVEQSEAGFLASPPHRKNLLNPDYNVAGFGIVRQGAMLYVTQDFGHSLPTDSSDQARLALVAALGQVRSAARLGELEAVDDAAVQAAACELANDDSLSAPGGHLSGGYIVRYTATEPASLPAAAVNVIRIAGLRRFSMGVCYRQSASYPNGMYWVVLRLE